MVNICGAAIDDDLPLEDKILDFTWKNSSIQY